jgi:predicted dehydrogenase
MTKIRCAVLGVGYLGRFHAQKYQQIPQAQLVAVCDSNPQTAKAVGEELSVPYFTDYQALLDEVDAVSIAATTSQHYELAKAFLEKGVHVLIEKPITQTVHQAQELIDLAKAQHVKLQVGHLERFNSARLAIEPYLRTPQFIESERLAPFKPRGIDVNVILDLMIHDIDIIQHMVKAPILSIEAQGAPVLTSEIDIANARITFANHCVANVTASRISFKSVRKTRIFQNDSYLSIDYQTKEFAYFKKGTGEMFPGIPDIVSEIQTIDSGDALFEEIKAFVACIEQDSTPLVTGEEGRDALQTAARISALIQSNLEQRHAKA